MMMILGFFIFELATTPFQQLERTQKQKWASNKRVGQRDAHQYVGVGDDDITLTGILHPEFTGGEFNLDILNTMASTGSSYLLITGTGDIWGYFKIDEIKRTRTVLFNNGQARKIEFSLSLKRTDNNSEQASSTQLGALIGVNEVVYDTVV